MTTLHQHLDKIRIPKNNEEIYKDECVYSYDTPETSTGLYVSLTSFLGFGENYVSRYAEKTGNSVFLHIRREKILKNKANIENEGRKEELGPNCKITRLAIGVDGGYNEKDFENYDYQETYSIVVAPDIEKKISYPSSELPLIVTEAVMAVLNTESVMMKWKKHSLTGTWDGEVRQISKYSDTLVQLNINKKIPPSGWKCEKCDLTNNLWLNLTDGTILCGRKFFDGSGGNDHAVKHYQEFGYPLAVKLGTITVDGKADVFSYPEDDMVIDSNLSKHLAHFGINMAMMIKSEKSMVELELEINQRIGEWSLLTECEDELQPLAGPGYTGMQNLGNSCYISSVMQVLFTIPDFIKQYVGVGADAQFNRYPYDPANDFNIQMSKLGNGLWSGKYSKITENSLDSNGIIPTMFKNVVGKNHPDFSTKHQQDAFDFYLYVIKLVERNCQKYKASPVEALKFTVEERVECMTSKKVRYTRRDEYCLPLPIPLDKAINLDEMNEYLERQEKNIDRNVGENNDIVRYKISLGACLESFFASEIIDQFYSSAIKSKTTAKKTSRLINMPDYLMIHLRKFTMGDDWIPKKLDVSIHMPDEIDISMWRATGKQPDEEELCDETNTQVEQPIFTFDESVVSTLMQMGFPREACRRAIYHTKNNDIELASNWLMEHIGDSDFSEPFIIPGRAIGDNNNGTFIPNPESVATLMMMGFDESQAMRALKATDGNLERATDWIFSHNDENNMQDINATVSTVEHQKSYRDGIGKYTLVAFISHMGASAHVGHYVCHIRRDNQWVIFNDNKVAISKNPPKDLGYLYLYKRIL